jgi:hypothetical protein
MNSEVPLPSSFATCENGPSGRSEFGSRPFVP